MAGPGGGKLRVLKWSGRRREQWRRRFREQWEPRIGTQTVRDVLRSLVLLKLGCLLIVLGAGASIFGQAIGNGALGWGGAVVGVTAGVIVDIVAIQRMLTASDAVIARYGLRTDIRWRVPIAMSNIDRFDQWLERQQRRAADTANAAT